jgi:dTDP-4-dehydrorhamnose 3,5-epimerase
MSFHVRRAEPAAMVETRPLSLVGLTLVTTPRFSDKRGHFAETFSRSQFAAAGICNDFVQDNHSLSTEAGTVRGLHFQIPPYAQTKLIRVVRGRIFDVVVDLRRTSPSYGKHLAIELNDHDGEQLFVPAGFAHGFCTLAPNTEVFYKVDAIYAPTHDRGIHWADPALGVHWPINEHKAIVSDKDRALPNLDEIPYYFE